MSCPDWSDLVARRDAEPGGEAAWDDALVHFDVCPTCRDEALRAEPTLLFRTLRSPEGETVPGVEVAAMQQAVSVLCRAHDLETREPRRLRRPGGARTWFRLAAVLAVLLGAALLTTLSGPAGLRDGARPAEADSAQVDRPPSAGAAEAGDLRPAALDLSHIPLVEEVDPELGTLVQLDDQDVSIVMVLAQGVERGHV